MTDPGTDIDLRHQPSLLEQKVMYARYLAKADLVPRAYRDKPGNVLVAIQYGDALGIEPVVAMNEIWINPAGKPTLPSSLMAAKVRQAGHRLRVEVDPVNMIANAMLWRRDDPEYAFRATWDMDRAKQAGLTSKDNWKHYPANMLKARAITEVCRDGAPECLAGIGYTPDEGGAEFLTDTERAEQGLMSISEAVEHERLTVTPHDRSKTERVLHYEPGNEDTALWETDPEDTSDDAG